MSAATIEPGSFRDPHSRVPESDGALRLLRLSSGTRVLYVAQPKA